MRTSLSNLVDALQDPAVKAFILEIMDLSLPSQDKYQMLIDYFQQDSEMEDRAWRLARQQMLQGDAEQIRQRLSQAGQEDIQKIVSQAGQEIGIWNPQEILLQAEDSIRRAIRRLRHGQHRDGGWGPRPEESDFWGTAFAVLCLNSAKALQPFPFDVELDPMLQRGIDWLEAHSHLWSADLTPTGMKPVYHLSLAIRCFYQAGRESFSPVAECVKKLVDSQNQDGGWDAHIWGPAMATPTRVYSEIGATSYAIQAFAQAHHKNEGGTIMRALAWLIKTQNEDGSWNDGSCRPGVERLDGYASINKTCEALQGILGGQDLGLPLEGFQDKIGQAIAWLQSQEKPILSDDRTLEGWGWRDFDNTCLTLETLVRMSDVSLPLLSSNARWLIKHQYKQDGDFEDGNWQHGHTARIALSLIEYYKIIKQSSMFSPH